MKQSAVKTTVVRSEDSFKRVIIRQDYGKKNVRIHCFVAGYHYHDGESIIDLLKPREELLLVRELYNPYDPHAVAVYSKDYVQLGYVPRIITPLIAPKIESDTVSCQLRKINRKEYYDDYVRLEIMIRFPADADITSPQ